MKQLQLEPIEALAGIALVGLTVGVAHVAGIGWALIALCSLVLLYIVLPEQGTKT